MKKILINTALILTSILLTYGLMEVFFRVSLPHLPMALFNSQCRELRTVGQTSKKDKVPTAPYIAILGDSYGIGQGDWFADNRYNQNSRYHTAHVLQDLTGQDVISLSRAGAGNYDGAAIYAINTFRYLNDSGFDYPAPETIVVYFYEGNDINDNVRFMKRYFSPEHNDENLFDDEAFAEFANRMDTEHSQGDLPRLQDKFLVANLMSRFVEGIIYSANKKANPLPPGTRYKAIMNGEEVWLPDTVENDLTTTKERSLAIGVRFYERALHRVSQYWPDSKKIAVYIPSPLTTYDLVGEKAKRRLDISRELEEMVRKASLQNDFEFVNISTELRQQARSKYFHGPKDWNHFNRAGYELLGKALAKNIQQ